MKISIITATFNSEETIRDTLKSIQQQTYPQIESIIIDGVSKDNTVSIVKNEFPFVAKVVSEPDKGIYDAMNKGIRTTTGEIVGILNSDDVYYAPETISEIMELFKDPSVGIVFGDLEYVDRTNIQKVIRYWKSSVFKQGRFSRGWHPPHPAFFVRKSVYDKHGLFNLNFKISADFELMLRFLEKEKVKSAYLPKTIVKMRVGGESNKSVKNILTGNKNIKKAFEENGVPYPIYYPILRLVPKLLQYVIK